MFAYADKIFRNLNLKLTFSFKLSSSHRGECGYDKVANETLFL
ncbi:hypothetical protein DB41_FI00090 [Neochlamydia sp. TUME1]|nr:hypothetical protein DB41_FI00090 [Neochlamydia sp. TUME1]